MIIFSKTKINLKYIFCFGLGFGGFFCWLVGLGVGFLWWQWVFSFCLFFWFCWGRSFPEKPSNKHLFQSSLQTVFTQYINDLNTSNWKSKSRYSQSQLWQDTTKVVLGSNLLVSTTLLIRHVMNHFVTAVDPLKFYVPATPSPKTLWRTVYPREVVQKILTPGLSFPGPVEPPSTVPVLQGYHSDTLSRLALTS